MRIMSELNSFLVGVGIITAILGIIAMIVIGFVLIYVRVIGKPLTLLYQKDDDESEEQEQ